MNTKELIAKKLMLARQQAGLSQNQVALLLKMHRPSISEIENGRRNVTSEELISFANIYGVSLNWITEIPEEELDEKKITIELAARELAKLKDEDLNKIINLLRAIKGK